MKRPIQKVTRSESERICNLGRLRYAAWLIAGVVLGNTVRTSAVYYHLAKSNISLTRQRGAAAWHRARSDDRTFYDREHPIKKGATRAVRAPRLKAVS